MFDRQLRRGGQEQGVVVDRRLREDARRRRSPVSRRAGVALGDSRCVGGATARGVRPTASVTPARSYEIAPAHSRGVQSSTEHEPSRPPYPRPGAVEGVRLWFRESYGGRLSSAPLLARALQQLGSEERIGADTPRPWIEWSRRRPPRSRGRARWLCMS
jgi:hypothetical protein